MDTMSLTGCVPGGESKAHTKELWVTSKCVLMTGGRQARRIPEFTVKQTACGWNTCAQLPIQKEKQKGFQ